MFWMERAIVSMISGGFSLELFEILQDLALTVALIKSVKSKLSYSFIIQLLSVVMRSFFCPMLRVRCAKKPKNQPIKI